MRSALSIAGFTLAALLSTSALAQTPWSHNGELTDADSQTGDEHRLRLDAGRRYRLTVESEAFDPVARLYRAGEDEPVAENDDSGGGLNSRINYAPETGGDYVLRVTGFAADARGAYAAAVAEAPPLPPANSTPGTPTAVTGTWLLWQGELAASDPDSEGRHYDDYLISVAAGQTRYITLDAPGFDGLVQLIRAEDRDSDPPSTVDSDDDTGPGLNPLLGFRPDEAGDYIVRVGSYGEGGLGPYRLWISQ